MTRILRLATAAGVQRQGVESWPLRRVMRSALFRVALLAVRLAARLDAADARTRAEAAQVASLRPYAAARGSAIWLVEAMVYLGVAALFVAGLVGVFVA